MDIKRAWQNGKKRLKKQSEPFTIWLFSWIGFCFVSLIHLTTIKRFEGNAKIEDSSKPVIVVFWHEHLLMMPFLWRKLRRDKPNARVFVIASDHGDGEIIARIILRLGVNSVRGSSTRGGVKALLGSIKELENGNDAAFTPDGPRGPRHSIADGVILAAQKCGAPIIPLSYSASRCWRLKSWDRFVVPKPFCALTFRIAPPISLEGLERSVAKQRIKEALCDLET
ncbi:lipoprotein [Campylobacterota bacterium]|nr:lipoprotein [Campylobacterota bacterium]